MSPGLLRLAGGGVTVVGPESACSRLSRVVGRALQAHGLAHRERPLLVAVSGGPDSTALLYTLTQLREALGLRLQGAHLDHGLGNRAVEDPEAVRRLALSLGVPLRVGREDVPAYARAHRLSPEDAARRVRYAFLAGAAREVGADTVALGHTADDQAETVLLHLVRGTGIRGLRGMQPLTLWEQPHTGEPVWLFRPLLEAKRRDTVACCDQAGLRPLEDESNRWPRFARNRLRHEVLPLLRQLNPSVEEALARLARAATHDDDLLQREALRHWGAVARQEEAAIYLDRAGLSRLHPALQRRLLQHAYAQYTGRPGRLAQAHLEGMVTLLSGAPGRRWALPGGITFSTNSTECLLGPEPGEACPLPPLAEEYCLHVPGTTRRGPWEVVAGLQDPAPLDGGGCAMRALLDADAAGDILMVRSRRPGDRFHPLGMEGPKKLQDFFVDQRVPRAWRERVPLVVGRGGILWVVGHRIAHGARVTGGTRRVLALEFRRRGEASHA